MGVIKEHLGYRHEVVGRQLSHASGDTYGEAYDHALGKHTLCFTTLSENINRWAIKYRQQCIGQASVAMPKS